VGRGLCPAVRNEVLRLWEAWGGMLHAAREGTLFIQLFHGQQRMLHLSLTQPLSEPQGAALGLKPLKSFPAQATQRHPCPSRDTAGHVLPQQLCAVLTSDQGTCMLSWLFPNLSGAPKVPFLPQVPVSTLQAARARTTLCLVPIAAVLLVLIIKLRLYKKKEWASWDRSSHALFLLPAFLL